MTLAAQYYVSTETFEREQQQIFHRHWTFLGHQSDWPQTRSFQTTTLGKYPLVTWRTTDQQILCFHNVCRHRGAVLAAESCGRLERDHCVCPYHGWSYDQQGRLAGAPNMADVENFDRSRWGLKPAFARVDQGLVFVSPEQPDPISESAWNQLSSLLESWNIGQLMRGHRLDYQVDANWKVIFENYSECYHCPLVHPTLNRLTPYAESSNCFDVGGVLGGPMRLAPGISTMSMDGEPVGGPLPGLDADQKLLVYYFTVFPNCFISLHPDYVMIHRLTPISPGKTDVQCDFFVSPDIDVSSSGLSAAVEFWDQTNRQDWSVCERVQRGVNSPSYQPGPLSNLESIVAAFDRHYLTLLEGEALAEPA